MGHFYTMVRGKGKNRREAERAAVDEFLHENGHRHSVYDVGKPKLLGKVAPMGVIYTAHGQTVHDYTKPNLDAPADQWLEEWEFELHTHA